MEVHHSCRFAIQTTPWQTTNTLPEVVITACTLYLLVIPLHTTVAHRKSMFAMLTVDLITLPAAGDNPVNHISTRPPHPHLHVAIAMQKLLK